jgi:Ca2+-transporting ATPase
MDTMAALALATDPPSPQLLDRKPSKRSEPIISFFMALMIGFQGAFQIAVCMLVYLKGSVWFLPPVFDNGKAAQEYASALVFNTFVFCQIYNEVNCRSISKGIL